MEEWVLYSPTIALGPIVLAPHLQGLWSLLQAFGVKSGQPRSPVFGRYWKKQVGTHWFCQLPNHLLLQTPRPGDETLQGRVPLMLLPLESKVWSQAWRACSVGWGVVGCFSGASLWDLSAPTHWNCQDLRTGQDTPQRMQYGSLLCSQYFITFWLQWHQLGLETLSWDSVRSHELRASPLSGEKLHTELSSE